MVAVREKVSGQGETVGCILVGFIERLWKESGMSNDGLCELRSKHHVGFQPAFLDDQHTQMIWRLILWRYVLYLYK